MHVQSMSLVRTQSKKLIETNHHIITYHFSMTLIYYHFPRNPFLNVATDSVDWIKELKEACKVGLFFRFWKCLNLNSNWLRSHSRKFWYKIFNLDCHHRLRQHCNQFKDGASYKQHCHIWCIRQVLYFIRGERMFVFSCKICWILIYWNCHRVKDMHQLGAAEVKLLYTLQWIFLQAADECDDEYEPESTNKQKQQYLFSVPTLTVLIRIFETPKTIFILFRYIFSCSSISLPHLHIT